MDDLAQTVLTAVTGKDVRSAMAQAISQWDSAKGDIFERLEAVEAKANQASQDVDDLRNRIDEVNTVLNQRIDELNQRKATHDDVADLRKEMHQIRDDWHDRASHIALGTDIETTKAVVEQILQEKGMI